MNIFNTTSILHNSLQEHLLDIVTALEMVQNTIIILNEHCGNYDTFFTKLQNEAQEKKIEIQKVFKGRKRQRTEDDVESNAYNK